MAFLNETEQWESGVYQLETTDPVQGGPGGIDNRPHTALANRTLWLKTKMESLAAQIVAGVDAATLQGKSVAQIEADIIAAISDGASSAYDTLIEIQNAIEDNDIDIASLLSTLSTKADRGGDPTQRFKVAAAIAADEAIRFGQAEQRYLRSEGLSLSENGYQILSTGLILQWGIANSPNDSVNSIIFPIAFPNLCAYVSVGGHQSTGENAGSVMTSGYTQTGFLLDRQNASYDGEFNFYYFALGY